MSDRKMFGFKCIFRQWLGALILMGLTLNAFAQLSIEITGGSVTKFPVALSTFAGENQLTEQLTPIIRADLEQSGLFQIVGVSIDPPTSATVPDPQRWRAANVEALVTGAVRRNADGSIDVGFRLFDTVHETQLIAQGYHLTPQQIRATAHRISDAIYAQLIGEPGIFSTRIAYVAESNKSYSLQVSDADGYNMQSVIRSNAPIISPAWSPDGTRVAYVSFEKKKPIVYVQSLVDGSRKVIADYRGSNSSPTWSPNGQNLAIVLTKDGTQQIYLVNANGGNLRRLTHSNRADTEPVFSPDGTKIYFTSDRGGSPQIYQMNVNGGEVQRLTFNGNYNAGATISPDGRQLAYVTTSGGGYQVAVMDLSTRQSVILGNSRGAERPVFSPNGRMLLFASRVNGRDVLVAASTDGRSNHRLSLPAGKVREPSWGPLR